jgi:hypothetical protein
MLTGAHIVIYSTDPEADRTFFGETLALPAVDAGRGWLIFGLPAAEAAFHPHDRNDKHELYLVCEDLQRTISVLEKRGVRFGEIHEEQWGTRTTMTLPGGGGIGLYEAKHPTTFGKKAARRKPAKTKPVKVTKKKAAKKEAAKKKAR